MPGVQRTIIVQAPVDRVYQWWARMENIPHVMPNVREVKRTGPFQTHWRAEGADGDLLEWDAAIVHDLPQRQLEWESRTGPLPHRGHVDFEALAGNRTRLSVTIQEGQPGSARGTGLLTDQLDVTLERFQRLIEAQTPEQPPLAVAYPYRDLFYKAMAAVAGGVVVFALAWSLVALIEVWMIILGALLLAATLNPAVAWLERWLPRPVAASATFLAALAALSVVFVVLIPDVMRQGQELAAKLPAYAADLQAMLSRLHAQNPSIPAGNQVMDFVAEQGSVVLGNLFSITTRFIWIVVVVLSILFLAFFVLLDAKRLQDTVLRLLPITQKYQMPALIHTVQERIGQFMLGLAFICALAGLITWGALAWMGVPYALLIGAVTTLLQAIPFVGPLIGGAIAALIALSKSPETAVWTVVVYAVIQQVIGQFLFPVIMGRTLGMHPVWIAIALLVGGTLYGLVGAFVALPIAIAISIVMECYYIPWAEARAAEQAASS